MAEAAVTFLLDNVTKLVTYYADLVGNAENELNDLKFHLGLLQGFLQEADKKSYKEEPFKVMERKIREVVYEAEDAIDECLTLSTTATGDGAAKRKEKWYRRKAGPMNTNTISLAEKVRGILQNKVRPMFDHATREFATMEIADGSGKHVHETQLKLKKVQSIRQDNVVGFKDEEEKITGFIMDRTKVLDVISIIGMPGLGKTTLAWKIFHSKEIQYEFPYCIWVYVSQAWSSKDVFAKILSRFQGGEDVSGLDEPELSSAVRQHLEDSKFLLVLDDVWTKDAWDAIKVVLPKRNCTSKVLITSRYTEVGVHANCFGIGREPHQLRFLDEAESWELLQLEVFGEVDVVQDEGLRRTGNTIAKKCDGLPLAIVVIGGILLSQLASSERPRQAIINDWEDVRDNLSTYLIKGEDSKGISDVVALSYGILPKDLRDCFLYLGVFPEDYLIPTWTLTRLWIAEGFIRHKEGQSLEETAEENLKDLIARNLLMVKKRNPNGEVKICQVHDTIRAFCILKASFEEQNLFKEIKMPNGVLDPKVSEIHKYRRLCIHSDLPDFLSQYPKGPHVRSFLCYNKASADLESSYGPYIPDNFKLLRVFDSISIKQNELCKIPDGFTRLIHLRYITLSIDQLKILPEAISKLRKLQTLFVETSSRTIIIEVNIWKLFELRHLKTKAAIELDIKTPEKDERGDNLQTLSNLSPNCCTKDVFKRASNLKRLGIRGRLATLSGTSTKSSLKELCTLEKLKLVNERSYGLAAKDRMRYVPEWSWFPEKLKRLTLSSTSLEWEHMATLAKISTLEILKLKDKAFTGDSWDVDECFKSLHFLLINDADLEYWTASAKHFPRLTSLVLNNCENLTEIPFGLAEPLELLEIDILGKSAVESAKKIAESKKPSSEQPKARWGRRFKLSIGPGCKH